jgi:hypothetical protein
MCSGGFVKRDGRPREIETLISRLVDRPLRPLFQKGWRRDTQILQWVLSYDPDSCPQPHAITAAAASLLVSDIPFPCAVAGVRVGLCDGELIINPTVSEREAATVDLLVAGTKSAVLMIEGSANFVPEETVLEAIGEAQSAIAEICSQLQVRSKLQVMHIVLLHMMLDAPSIGFVTGFCLPLSLRCCMRGIYCGSVFQSVLCDRSRLHQRLALKNAIQLVPRIDSMVSMTFNNQHAQLFQEGTRRS